MGCQRKVRAADSEKRGRGRGRHATRDTSRSAGGLRHFSFKVVEKIRMRSRTTYNAVANELVDDLNSNGASAKDGKSIRRRCYDAINVLLACGLIKRDDKKQIVWRGHSNVEVERLRAEVENRRLEVERKRLLLQEVERKHKALEALLERGAARDRQQEREREGSDSGCGASSSACSGSGSSADGRLRISLPFMLVQARAGADVRICTSDDKTFVEFEMAESPLQLHDDSSVVLQLQSHHQSLQLLQLQQQQNKEDLQHPQQLHLREHSLDDKEHNNQDSQQHQHQQQNSGRSCGGAAGTGDQRPHVPPTLATAAPAEQPQQQQHQPPLPLIKQESQVEEQQLGQQLPGSQVLPQVKQEPQPQPDFHSPVPTTVAAVPCRRTAKRQDLRQPNSLPQPQPLPQLQLPAQRQSMQPPASGAADCTQQHLQSGDYDLSCPGSSDYVLPGATLPDSTTTTTTTTDTTTTKSSNQQHPPSAQMPLRQRGPQPPSPPLSTAALSPDSAVAAAPPSLDQGHEEGNSLLTYFCSPPQAPCISPAWQPLAAPPPPPPQQQQRLQPQYPQVQPQGAASPSQAQLLLRSPPSLGLAPDASDYSQFLDGLPTVNSQPLSQQPSLQLQASYDGLACYEDHPCGSGSSSGNCFFSASSPFSFEAPTAGTGQQSQAQSQQLLQQQEAYRHQPLQMQMQPQHQLQSHHMLQQQQRQQQQHPYLQHSQLLPAQHQQQQLHAHYMVVEQHQHPQQQPQQVMRHQSAAVLLGAQGHPHGLQQLQQQPSPLLFTQHHHQHQQQQAMYQTQQQQQQHQNQMQQLPAPTAAAPQLLSLEQMVEEELPQLAPLLTLMANDDPDPLSFGFGSGILADHQMGLMGWPYGMDAEPASPYTPLAAAPSPAGSGLLLQPGFSRLGPATTASSGPALGLHAPQQQRTAALHVAGLHLL